MGRSSKYTKCDICEKEISNNGFHRHILRCGREPIEKKPRIGKNQYTKARESGLPDPIISDETRKKLSESSKNQIWTDERRENLSKSMKKAVLDNPESYTSSNVCGRIKVEEYNGEKFHGKWEVEVAKWFDKNEIIWERKVKPFNYFWNNSWHLYFPDFYLPRLDVYIEVKGYETERDRCKWVVVPNLIVIKNKEIKQIKENIYALVTHLVESAPLIREEAGFESLTAHQM